jgi:hypothetical protein
LVAVPEHEAVVVGAVKSYLKIFVCAIDRKIGERAVDAHISAGVQEFDTSAGVVLSTQSARAFGIQPTR